jgi:hypothetical protein
VKKLILTLTALGMMVSAYGQGKIAWANALLSTSQDFITVKALDGTIANMPAKASGQLYYFALFTSSVSAADLLNVGPIGYGTNAAAGKFGAASADAGVAGGTVVWYQIRGWSANAGATWAEASARVQANDASVWFGQSAVGQFATVAAPSTPGNVFTTTIPGNIAIDGFTLASVPEPSTIALIGLGLAGLIFIRRRK